MKISVIIPSYKPQAYLYDCLLSLNMQTINIEEFEIILILNGCKEPYESKIRKFLMEKINKNNTHLIQTDILGVSNARNLGLDVAKGEYICFIDDDDIVSPRYLEGLLSVSSKNVIGISNLYSFKQSIQSCNDNFFICKQLRQKEKYIGKSLYKCRSFLSFPVAKMIHCNIISNQRFDTRFTNGEDALFITSITDKLSSISFAGDDVVYYVREREGSASRKKIKISKITRDSILLISAYFVTYIKKPKKYNLLLYISRIPGVLKNAYILLNN